MKKTTKKKLVLAKETVRTMTAVHGGTHTILSECWESLGGHTCTCHNSNYVDCEDPSVETKRCG